MAEVKRRIGFWGWISDGFSLYWGGLVQRFGKFRAYWLTALMLLLGALALAYFLPPDSVAHVDAITEVAELRTIGDAKKPSHNSRPLRWELSGAIVQSCSERTGESAEFTMGEGDALEILPGAHVKLQRLDGSPFFRILIETAEPDERPSVNPVVPNLDGKCGRILPVRRLASDGRASNFHGERIVAVKRFESTVGLPWTDAALVLPLDAELTVGQEVGDGGGAMVLSGSASIHAAHEKPDWLVGLLHLTNRRQTYISEQLPLQRGDRLSIPIQSEVGIAKGFFRIPAVGAIQVAAYGPGPQVEVMRAGNARVEIGQSIWSRFENEPLMGGVLALLALLVALLEVWVSLHEHKPHEILDNITHSEGPHARH